MSASEASQSFDSKTQELVLLVHGTFANDGSRSRSNHLRWWQKGGDVWNRIDQQLPEQFHVASDPRKEVFSWSGDNSERDRRAGGRQLFNHLQKLEKAGIRYHLVGHSHGGSVIWHCLLESVKQRLKRRRNDASDRLSLPGLQSYTTIGTPFLQLKSLGLASRLNPWFWLLALITTTGTIVLLTMAKRLGHFDLPWHKTIEKIDSTLSDLVFQYFDQTIAAAVWGLLAAILDNPLASVGFGLAIAALALFAMVMWAWASAVQLEAAAVREDDRIRDQAFVEFGSRWLGIWSVHDEAINGLKASLTLGGHIAPRIEVSGGTVFDFDRRMRTYRFFARWFIAPVFNLLVALPSDKIIWRGISRGMQGNDRPGCTVQDITHGPIVSDNVEWEQLPEAYDKRLVDQSNGHLIDRSKTLLPQMREVLSQLAWTRPEQLSLLLSKETTFEGNELVHTSYFNEPAILELIACHILRHNRVNARRANQKSATTRWCRRFRHKARDLARDPSLQEKGFPLFGQRNLRSVVALVLAMALIVVLWWADTIVAGINDLLKLFTISTSSAATSAVTIGAVAGILASIAVAYTAFTSVQRVSKGARHPKIARWAWRLSRVAVLLYLLIAVVCLFALFVAGIGSA
ncbi:MAG: hypothetical protein HQ518_09675 [Rhodopirellula sp.]|nr:hypothetical protein [Rhodopirellula sp.]